MSIQNRSPTNGLITISGTVTVASNSTLTIVAGSQLKFGNYALLVVNGGLVARGTTASPISFFPVNAGTNRYQGISFSTSAKPATFDANGQYVSGCIIEHASFQGAGYWYDFALRLQVSVYLNDVNTTDSYSGIYVNNVQQDVRFENLYFNNATQSGYPIQIEQGSGECISENTMF
jgi:hypothetical protein